MAYRDILNWLRTKTPAIGDYGESAKGVIIGCENEGIQDDLASEINKFIAINGSNFSLQIDKPKRLVLNRCSNLALLSIPPLALKVLRLSGCPTIRTVEVAKLSKAPYPLWAWSENPTWEEPSMIDNYRQVMNTSFAFFTSVVPLVRQYVVCLVRYMVVDVWLWDGEWLEVNPDDSSYPSNPLIDLSINAMYSVGLDVGAVRVADTLNDPVVMSIGVPTPRGDLAPKYYQAISLIEMPIKYKDVKVGVNVGLAVVDSSTFNPVPWKYPCPENLPWITHDSTSYFLNIAPGTIPQVVKLFGQGLDEVSNLIPYNNLALTNQIPKSTFEIVSAVPLSWETVHALDNYLSLPLIAVGAMRGINNMKLDMAVDRLSYCVSPAVPATQEWVTCILTLAKLVIEKYDLLDSHPLDEYRYKVSYLQGQGPSLLEGARQAWDKVQGLDLDEEIKAALSPISNVLDGGENVKEAEDLRKLWGLQIPSDSWKPDSISLSESVMKKWNLTAGQKVLATFGNNSAEVEITPFLDSGKDQENWSGVSHSVLAKLGAPEGWSLQIKRPSTNGNGLPNISVGPILGVLVRKNSNRFGPYSWRTPLIRDLIRLARRRHALMVAISPEDISLESNTVKGYVPESGGRWTELIVPLPEAIYDRYISATWSEARLLVSLRQDLLTKGVKFYNSPSFAALSSNKIKAARRLGSVPSLSGHIPMAWPFKEKTLTLVLDNNPGNGLIIKPIYGTQGSGITIVEPDLSVSFKSAQYKFTKKTFSTLQELMDFLESRSKDIQMLIQPLISTMKYKERVFTLRTMMQKSTSGNWLIIDSLAQVEPLGGMVVDLYSKSIPIERFIPLLGNETNLASGLISDIKSLAYKIAAVCDDITEGVSEMGIDMVVDTQGHLWILEINSKPWGPERTIENFQIKRRAWLGRIISRLKFISDYHV